MTPIHPRVLIAALDDLQESCSRWLVEGRDTLAQTATIQRLEEQEAQTISRRAVILLSQAQDDHDHVLHVKSDVEMWRKDCLTTRQDCNLLLEDAQKKQIAAKETLEYWQNELDDAEEWLSFAIDRMERAEAEFHAAEQNYESARHNYNSAVNRYNRCLGSEEGKKRGCGSLLASVQRAQERLEIAEYRLRLAVAELEAARHELEHAQARFSCCKSSVEDAQQAVKIADESVERAEQALVEAERSVDYADAAFKFVMEAEDYAERQVDHAEKMLSFTLKDRQALGIAANAHQRADKLFESAQRLIILSRQELDYRITMLTEFDQTGLL